MRIHDDKTNYGGETINITFVDGTTKEVKLLNKKVYLLGRAKNKVNVPNLPVEAWTIESADHAAPYTVVRVTVKISKELYYGVGVSKRDPIDLDPEWISRRANIALFRALKNALTQYWFHMSGLVIRKEGVKVTDVSEAIPAMEGTMEREDRRTVTF